ncbi:MAG: TRAP transporter large permease subunit [Alphaproteobacteria bacterium]|nr:TRAP transporter large permease subunit [Alphaproteobacteria bacterium]
MFASVCGVLILGFPVAFTLAGIATLFAFLGALFGVFDLGLLLAFPQRIFAVMSSEVLVAVPLFVFLGVMLERSKVAEDLLGAMSLIFGARPGGLAISVTLVGMLLAASTGIVGATVVTMGLLALPTMLNASYNRAFSCGTICAAGTLGQIIPPSIVLVILGDQISIAYQNAQYTKGIFAPDTVSVNDLFAGALIPGLVLVLLYLAYQAAYALLNPAGAPAATAVEVEMDTATSLRRLVGSLFAPLLLIVAVLGSILAGIASPTEAAAVGAVGALMLAGYRLSASRGAAITLAALCLVFLLVLTVFFDLRMQRDVLELSNQAAFACAVLLAVGLIYGIWISLRRTYGARDEGGVPVLVSVMRSTLQISAMIFVILIGATMFSLVFRGLGGDRIIEEFLQTLPGGTLAAVLLVMTVMFVMGFFLDFLEIVFIVVPIVAPIMLQMEIAPGELMHPVWLGVMMGINIQTSFLTPPFGFALFYLRGVAPDAIGTSDIYKGVVPFIGLQLCVLVALWLAPELATWLPTMLYGR